MTDDQANAGEGADPAADIKKQNPGETTTGDLAGGDRHKAEDAAKAGRDDLDPDAGQE